MFWTFPTIINDGLGDYVLQLWNGKIRFSIRAILLPTTEHIQYSTQIGDGRGKVLKSSHLSISRFTISVLSNGPQSICRWALRTIKQSWESETEDGGLPARHRPHVYIIYHFKHSFTCNSIIYRHITVPRLRRTSNNLIRPTNIAISTATIESYSVPTTHV